MQLGNHIFTSSNFIMWSITIRMALIARNKLGFLDGSILHAADSDDYIVKSGFLTLWIKSWLNLSFFSTLLISFGRNCVRNLATQMHLFLLIFTKKLVHTEQNDASNAEYFGNSKKILNSDQLRRHP